MIRLNKFIASTGYCSRRAADALIEEGKVFVNNFPITKLGTQIDPDKDAIRVGKKVIQPRKHVTIALNKPKGYVCTKREFAGEKSVMELLPASLQHLFPIGRLDKDSEGLLFLTNDGDLSLRLTHPSTKMEKEYEVTVKGTLTQESLALLLKGVWTGSYKARAAKIHLVHSDAERSVVRIILTQGKKRQIREMMFQVGHRVKKLVRFRVGKYVMDPRTPQGAFTYLSESDLKKLS